MKTIKIIPIILCGGKGTRLWPLSRQSYPKQFLNLYGYDERSLLQQTQTRINVRRIISLKDIINKPIDNIIFKFDNLKDLNILNSLSKNDAKTSVKFIVISNHENLIFELKDKRYIDQNIINSLNLEKNILDDYK